MEWAATSRHRSAAGMRAGSCGGTRRDPHRHATSGRPRRQPVDRARPTRPTLSATDRGATACTSDDSKASMAAVVDRAGGGKQGAQDLRHRCIRNGRPVRAPSTSGHSQALELSRQRLELTGARHHRLVERQPDVTERPRRDRWGEARCRARQREGQIEPGRRNDGIEVLRSGLPRRSEDYRVQQVNGGGPTNDGGTGHDLTTGQTHVARLITHRRITSSIRGPIRRPDVDGFPARVA